MSTHPSPSQPLVPEASPAFDTFKVFRNLPKELRHMVWRAAFDPCRLFLLTDSTRIPLDTFTGRFLLVNQEANTEFNMAYQLMLRGRNGVLNGMLVNPEKDTLHFHFGLLSLERFGINYPKDMAKIRYIEVNPGLESREQPMWKSVRLCCLSSIRTITVSSILDEEDAIRVAAWSGESVDPRNYEWACNHRDTIHALEVIKLSLAISKGRAPPNRPFPSPKLAGIFSGWNIFLSRLPIYFESNEDFTHASYGRLGSDILGTQSEPLRIQWPRKDELWAATDNVFTDYFENLPTIFAAIERARVQATPAAFEVTSLRRNLRYVADGPSHAYDFFNDMAWHLMGPKRGSETEYLQRVRDLTSYLRDAHISSLISLPITGETFLLLNKHLKDVLENPLVGLAATIDGEFLRLHEFCPVC